MKTQSVRRRDPRRRDNSSSRKRQPRKDPFTFQSLQDTPPGVEIKETIGTTEAYISSRHLGIGILFAAATIALGAFTASQVIFESTNAPMSFIIFLGIVTGVMAVFTLFHLFGYTRFRIENGQLYHFRGLMGIGTQQAMPLSSIKSIGTKRKNVRMRLPFGPAGMNAIGDEGFDGSVHLFIEGEQYIEPCKGVSAKGVYYAKYFVSHFVREAREKLKNRA